MAYPPNATTDQVTTATAKLHLCNALADARAERAKATRPIPPNNAPKA